MALAESAGRPQVRGLKDLLRLDARAILFIIVVGSIGFLVLYPLITLFLYSFQVGNFGGDTTLGLGNWTAAYNDPLLRKAMINTVTLTVTRQSIAFVIGVMLAWLLARTNVPGRNWLEFGFWIAFFLPTLPVLMGWIFLLDGHNGVINIWIEKLPFVDDSPFNIKSWWGIVFAHLVLNTLVIKVMLLTPAFRNMDASLEEAARTSGSGTFQTLFRVVIPILMPTIIVVTLLGTIRSLEAFEIEWILGTEDKIQVYSTIIFARVLGAPPEYGQSIALSMLVLCMIAPLVLLQQWYSRRRSYAVVSGKFSVRLHDLGRGRWVVFGVIAGLLFSITVVPIGFLILGSFMRFFGYFGIDDVYTTKHWADVIGNAQFIDSLKDTLIIATSASVVAMVMFTLVAYMIVRTRFRGRGTLDFISWLPTTVPGIVIGLGFLWLFLQAPWPFGALLRPLYGSHVALVLALMVAGMALGVQLIKVGMNQVSLELEEASWAAGASFLYTLRTIVLPLVAPTVAIVGVLTFVTAARNLSTVVLLADRSTQPLSVYQLRFIEQGDLEAGAVVGTVVLVLSMGVALIARFVGLRVGPGGRA
jgi:iron(III) transport system permease protein